eukprot:s9730_g2.t1
MALDVCRRELLFRQAAARNEQSSKLQEEELLHGIIVAVRGGVVVFAVGAVFSFGCLGPNSPSHHSKKAVLLENEKEKEEERISSNTGELVVVAVVVVVVVAVAVVAVMVVVVAAVVVVAVVVVVGAAVGLLLLLLLLPEYHGANKEFRGSRRLQELRSLRSELQILAEAAVTTCSQRLEEDTSLLRQLEGTRSTLLRLSAELRSVQAGKSTGSPALLYV